MIGNVSLTAESSLAGTAKMLMLTVRNPISSCSELVTLRGFSRRSRFQWHLLGTTEGKRKERIPEIPACG